MEQQTNLNCAIPPPARVPPGNRLGRTLQVWAVSPIETERRSLRRRTQTYLRRRSFDAEVSGLCPARCRSAIRCGRPVDLVVMLCPGDDGLALVREIRAAYPHCGILWGSDRDDAIHAWRADVDYFFLLSERDLLWQAGLRLWETWRALELQVKENSV